MRNNYKYNRCTLALMACSILILLSCKKGLDFSNPNSINPSQVWTDPTMIEAYLTDIYGGSMPGWSFDGNTSDEGIYSSHDLGNYQQGVITTATTYSNLNYTNIDKCNFMIDQLAGVPATVLSSDLNKQFVGEAKFWRAWAYWGMVQNIGGVPLILNPQDPTQPESLQVPRSKTSECINQIIQDLDDAAAALPASYTGDDYGRITSVAALGLKGRILLWWASPLFNPSNDPSRWQAAYDANKAAVTAADAKGYGLLPKFKDIWYKQNEEQIMVNQYFYPAHYMNFAPIRPMPFTNGAANANQPLLPLLLAFPKRDGSPMQFDRDNLSNPAYNAQFLTDFITNRDDRFYATIWVPGTIYPTPDMIPGFSTITPLWNAWKSNGMGGFVFIYPDVYVGQGTGSGTTGFYDIKGLDTTQTAASVPTGNSSAKSFWVPLRYAELLMNLGECANEINKTDEALDVVYRIRARANISSANNYGITAVSQSEIRELYIVERQVEFAFENQRLPTLRRLKRYDILNDQGGRQALLITLNPGAPTPAPTDNILTPAVRANFSATYVENIDFDPAIRFNFDLNHWFYALNPAQISIEPDMLPQNKEWGGSFDPLQ